MCSDRLRETPPSGYLVFTFSASLAVLILVDREARKAEVVGADFPFLGSSSGESKQASESQLNQRVGLRQVESGRFLLDLTLAFPVTQTQAQKSQS